MTSTLTKNINSNFTPTFMSGYPIYAYGGIPHKYGLGSFIKKNWTAAISPAIGVGSLISGKNANDFTQENAGIIGTGVGAAAGSLAGNPMLGAQIGGQVGSKVQGNYQQEQQEDMQTNFDIEQQKRGLVSNLPAQHYYMPTFADGGGLSRSKDYGSEKKPYPSVKSGDFAGGGRSYPIPTKADAVDALRLAGLHGRSDVKSKVYAKYPSLKKANGGLLDSYAGGGTMANLDNTTVYANGGTHESNINGGIPLGQNALVEENEVRFGDYIFSDRIPFKKK